MYSYNNYHDEETDRLKESILARLEVRIQETLKKPLRKNLHNNESVGK